MGVPWAIAKGGPVMIPIIIASILGLAIIIVKLWMLFRIRIDAQSFTDEVVKKIRANDPAGALSLCASKSSYPIGATLKAGLEAGSRKEVQVHPTPEALDDRAFQRNAQIYEVEKAMERAGNREVNRLEQYIGGLISIIGIEPLLGFLGTITGLIRAFMAWEAAGSKITVSQLAGGIYEAMITTAAGLIIAVPYYLICNFIISRIKYISFELSDCSMRLAEAIAEAKHG